MGPDPYKIVETNNGWAIHIDNISQPFDPDLPGDSPMDNLRAYKLILELAERLGYDANLIPAPLEIPLVP